MARPSIVVLLFLILSVLSSHARSQSTSNGSDLITMGNDNVRLSISQHGVIQSLKDLTTGVEVITPPQSATPAAWRASMHDSKDNFTSRDYDPPKVIRSPDCAIFTWQKAKSLKITAQVRFNRPQEQFELSTTVHNGVSGILGGITFPAELNFPDTAGNYLIVCSDDRFQTALKPLNTLNPFATAYPGLLFMQMAGFKIGDSSLLLYTNDDHAHVKSMKFTHEKPQVQMSLGQRVWLKNGQSWDAPYSIVLKVIPHGTYNELAAAYGTWARAQWWAKVKLTDKIARTPLLRRYFEDGLARFASGPPASVASYTRDEKGQWHYIEGGPLAKYEPYYNDVLRTIDEYQKNYGIAPGYWFPMWAGKQFDSSYPEYFPVEKCMGDFDAFRDALAAKGWPIMYHLNPALWDSGTKTAQIKKYLAVADKGFNYILPHSLEWSKVVATLPSPAVALPVELRTLNRIQDHAGANGIYMDVIGHMFATDINPLSPFAGKPNDYQLQKIELFKAARAAISGPYMTEARNEILLPYIDMGTGANGSPDGDEIPLWQMVYGDCLANVTNAVPHGPESKRLRYFTWMLGGVQNMEWEWPEVKGKNAEIFLTSAQQKVVSPMVLERMTRFDMSGDCRISQWPSGIVCWNKARKGQAVNILQKATLGEIQLTQLAPGGILVWNKASMFIADSIQAVSIDGRNVFRCSGQAGFVVTHSGVRWVFNNEHQQSIDAVVEVPDTLAVPSRLRGRTIRSGQTMDITPEHRNGNTILRVQIPAADCVVLEP